MDRAWIGRKLMFASRALAERYRESPDAGPGGEVLAPIVASLVREVGRSLALGETDPQLPFVRTRGMLRLPGRAAHTELARAYNALGVLVRTHVRQLPGITAEIDQQVRDGLRHAARTTIGLHRLMLAGAGTPKVEHYFGGVVVLEYRARRAG